jgi:hypothetical protein
MLGMEKIEMKKRREDQPPDEGEKERKGFGLERLGSYSIFEFLLVLYLLIGSRFD